MRNHVLMALAALAMIVSVSSCKKMGPLSQEYFKVSPSPLVAKGGVVNATITGTFPEKYLKKNATVTVTPVLKYNGQEKELKAATYQGEEVQGNDKKISYKAGGTYTQRVQFDFVPEMAKSELYLRFTVAQGAKSYNLPEVKVADGINYTYTLAKADGLEPAFAEDGFQHSVSSTQEAAINFLVAKTDIRSSELNKDEIRELMRKLQEVSENSSSSVKSVEISGYASPEGSVGLNTNLAEGRERVAVNYIDKQLKQIKQNVEIDSKYTAEDWDGFQDLVSKSAIQDKELILSVLSQFSDPDQREVEIRKLSAAYEVLATDILPQLRRSKMKVGFELAGKSDAELKSLVKSDPSSLSAEELLYAATLTDDLNEKEQIYQKAVDNYPSDWRAVNNLGAAKYLKGDFDGAEKQFSKAIDMNSSADETNYNWGIIKLHNGEIKIAEQFLGKAAGLGEKLDDALGVIYLHKGDYGAAEKALAGDKTNNAAVSKLVNKDNASAEEILGQVEEPNATTHYLKAIVAARKGNSSDLYNELKEAVKDNDLKKRAATDIEFAKYSNEEVFKSIVK